MSFAEDTSIWDDDVVAGSSRQAEAVDASSLSQHGTEPHPKKTSPLFEDLDAGWGAADEQTQPQQQQQEPKQEPDAPLTAPEIAVDVSSRELDSVDGAATAETTNETEHTAPLDTLDDNDAFDEFHDPEVGAGEAEQDDDFGDFGGEGDGSDAFDEPQQEGGTGLAPAATSSYASDAPVEAISTKQAGWVPLEFLSDSDDSDVASRIRQILDAPFADGRLYPFHDGAASQLSKDRVRQVEGPSQVLVREESRQVWDSISGQPALQPVDWMRSKTRRTYLISMGVPINLDEINNSAGENAKKLPPLALKLDASSARGSGGANGTASGADVAGGDASGRAAKSRASTKAPEIDMDRAKQLMNLTEEDLTLLALPALRDLQREMEQTTRQASTILTHYLQQRENHSADAEMYNGLIRDLVSGAAKRVGGATGASSGGAQRNASRRGGSLAGVATGGGSGRSSPAIRTASPQV